VTVPILMVERSKRGSSAGRNFGETFLDQSSIVFLRLKAMSPLYIGSKFTEGWV
jgi:hypothetical protein